MLPLNRTGARLRRLATVGFASLLLGTAALTPGPAAADPGDATCVPLYQSAGAISGRPSCRLNAGTAFVGLNNYYCTAEPARIARFCGPSPLLIGFFNGVWNSRDDATAGLAWIESHYGANYNGSPLRYNLFYNQTSGIGDIAETFMQRQHELNGLFEQRWELFWEMMASVHRRSDSFASTIAAATNAGVALLDALDSFTTAFVAGIAGGAVGILTSGSPTLDDIRGHADKLLNQYLRADVVSGAVLVAHSQGNLFVNNAYDIVKTVAPAASLEVVHIAPASPTLRGRHVLADIDLVINGLRNQGAGTVAPVNLALPASSADPSGHLLIGTYLDPSRAGLARVREMTDAALQYLSTGLRAYQG